MSRLIYTVAVECLSCGHDQAVEIQLSDGYTDADVREALGNAEECGGCYEIDWSPLLAPEGRAES